MARLKRLRMRSWRRGTKEMDLILGPFADTSLEQMSEADLATYDTLLDENDQDLLPWVLGQRPAPESLVPMIDQIAKAARARLQKP
jgi:antitoxin CptB